MPALMLAGALLARHNVKLGRGDRTRRVPRGRVVFVAICGVAVRRVHVVPPGVDIGPVVWRDGLRALQRRLFWLTYLGLEPYVRRHSPDSLIGWTPPDRRKAGATPASART